MNKNVIGLFFCSWLLATPTSLVAQGSGCAQLIASGAARSTELCEDACRRAGDANACNEAGRLFLDGIGVEQDHSRAFALFTVGCQRQLPIACHNLATMYHFGRGVAVSSTTAASHYSMACKSNVAEACFNLAYLCDTEQAVAQLCNTDLSIAHAGDVASLYNQACAGNVFQACHNLANLHLNGRRLSRRDPRAAEPLFAKACDGNIAEACFNLGAMHANGDLGARDPTAANRYFRRACAAGRTDACQLAGNEPTNPPRRPLYAVLIDVYGDGKEVGCSEYYITGAPEHVAVAQNKLRLYLSDLVTSGRARELSDCAQYIPRSSAVCRQGVESNSQLVRPQNAFEYKTQALVGTDIDSYTVLTYFVSWSYALEESCRFGSVTRLTNGRPEQ